MPNTRPWRSPRALQETCSEATEQRGVEVRQVFRAQRQHHPTVSCGERNKTVPACPRCDAICGVAA